MIHRLHLQDGVSASSLQIRNTSDQPLAVDIESYRLLLTDGVPSVGESADDKLLVFPPAVIIPPASAQVVQIQWNPETDIDSDQSFLVVVEQLPIDSSTSGVQMLLAFNAVIHVHKPNSFPILEVMNAELFPAGDPAQLDIEIHNTGLGHAFGTQMSLELSFGDQTRLITSEELLGYASDLFLPPDYIRTVSIPVPELTPETKVSVKVLYKKL